MMHFTLATVKLDCGRAERSALWKVHFWLKASSVGRDRLLVLNKVVMRVVVSSHLPLPWRARVP